MVGDGYIYIYTCIRLHSRWTLQIHFTLKMNRNYLLLFICTVLCAILVEIDAGSRQAQFTRFAGVGPQQQQQQQPQGSRQESSQRVESSSGVKHLLKKIGFGIGKIFDLFCYLSTILNILRDYIKF
ncbi:unnamed protein product [Heterobilharzia americana]|nr:unnamed protein product [Heterobilharzia americana]